MAETVHSCCLKSFQWSGVPSGRIGTLGSNQAYITGTDPKTAILFIHDLLGWSFPNARLLADHYASEVGATVYVPDFFGGETLPLEPILEERWAEIDVKGFVGRNSREIREPEVFACARKLRQLGYAHVGAAGFCYGGWAVFRLAAQEHGEGVKKLVDCIVVAHPSLSTKEDIDRIGVPTQMLAPAIDPAFTDELKLHLFQTLMRKGLPFDFQYFPGVVHGCMTRGDEKKDGERNAMVRGKDAAVSWFSQWLCR